MKKITLPLVAAVIAICAYAQTPPQPTASVASAAKKPLTAKGDERKKFVPSA